MTSLYEQLRHSMACVAEYRALFTDLFPLREGMRLWEIVGLEELVPFTTRYLGVDMYTNYGEIHPYLSLPPVVLRGARTSLGILNTPCCIEISTYNNLTKPSSPRYFYLFNELTMYSHHCPLDSTLRIYSEA